MNLRIAKILPRTAVEGFGLRFCIWVQGCSLHCPGCANRELWPFSGGVTLSTTTIIRKLCSLTETEGVTFLGGEPFDQPAPLATIARECRRMGKGIICFTGYTYEKLLSREERDTRTLLKHIDLLIDGPYQKDERSFKRPWVGSSNQRYLFLTDRYDATQLDAISNGFELRLQKDGVIQLNGMGDISVLTTLLHRRDWFQNETNIDG